MGLRLQETCYSCQMLKPWRSEQETSEEELFIKVRQKSWQNPFYRDLMLKLDTSCICRELQNQVFQIWLHAILEYLCRVSFLTTLDISKDYFKNRRKVMQSDNTCILWPETEFVLVHRILCRSYCVFTPRVLWPRSFPIFIVDEMKNFAANIFLKLVC